VRRAQAEWIGENRHSIRFFEPKDRIESIESQEQRAERIRQHGYDHVNRRMSLEELRAIPMMMPERLLRGASEKRIA
jgi:hypothetical protein